MSKAFRNLVADLDHAVKTKRGAQTVRAIAAALVTHAPTCEPALAAYKAAEFLRTRTTPEKTSALARAIVELRKLAAEAVTP